MVAEGGAPLIASTESRAPDVEAASVGASDRGTAVGQASVPAGTRVSAGRHFKALVHKNAILKRRQWSTTCCPLCPVVAIGELLLPLSILALLWWAKSRCLSGGQCSIPVLGGWGGNMPKDMKSSTCIPDLPLQESSGDQLGFSSCRPWTEVLQWPVPFHEVLAYLQWSGKTLALAVEDPADVQKLERMRDYISDNWHPDMPMVRIPCVNLEFALIDLEGEHLAGHNIAFRNDTLLPCKKGIKQWWRPGILRSFNNLTGAKIYTAAELEAMFVSGKAGHSAPLYGAVVFRSLGGNGTLGARGNWAYSIRLNVSSQTTPFTQIPPTRPLDLGLKNHEAFMYLNRGFMSIQLLIDRYILGMRNENSTVKDLLAANRIHLTPLDLGFVREQLAEPLRYAPQAVEAAAMPVAGLIVDGFYSLIAPVFPLVFIIAFLYTQKSIISELITEKETKVRESLRMMGVSSFAIIGSWYTAYGLVFAALCSVFAAVAGLYIFPSSSATLVFVFFWLWCMSFLAFAFFVHAFFSHARAGGIVGVVLMFFQWVLYESQNKEDQPASPAVMQSLMVMPNAAFCAGLDMLSKFEAAKVGASWSSLPLPVRNSTLGTVLIMMVFDIFLWTLLGWYLDRVLPKEFGTRMPWNFVCRRSYWFGMSRIAPAASADDPRDWHMAACCTLPNAVEPVPDSVKSRSAQSGITVQLEGLRREFSTPGGTKVAVAGLDLTMYEGQVLALLGHNGAGKSTTINMLTGMLSPSAGDAMILGRSVQTSMAEIRRFIGVCPQHDVLWLELTVLEHLKIFAQLRNVPAEDVHSRAASMMQEVGLTEKAMTRAGSLSGGQKRKLSLCLALVGQPECLFLDEPTSGMDPYSRRSTWNIIRDAREGRVTVLTTHFMDEADILGDRVAVMAEGELQCCGSPLFLKNRFGAGYRITCAMHKGHHVSNDDEEDQSAETVFEVIRKHIPEAELLTDVGAELSMRLPVQAAKRFADLFDELDSKLSALRVEHYGLSMVTMEEVFLRIASGESVALDTGAPRSDAHVDVRSAVEDSQSTAAASDDKDSVSDAVADSRPTALRPGREDASSSSSRDVVLASGHRVFLRHLCALFVKRVQYGRRDFKALACMVLIPVVYLVFGLWVLATVGNSNLPPVKLDMLEQYGAGHVVPVNVTSSSESTSSPADTAFSGAGFTPDLLPDGLDDGQFFGVNYSHGLPVADMCGLSKCWREQFLCSWIWSTLEIVRSVGVDIGCHTDYEGCTQALTSVCAHGAAQCTDMCISRGSESVSKAVCHRQCEEICEETKHLNLMCKFLVNPFTNSSTTIAWVCPVGCADPMNPHTCPVGTACDAVSSHGAADPAGTLALEMDLFAEGQGTARDNVRYAGIKISEREKLGKAFTLLYNTSAVHIVPTLLNLVTKTLKQASDPASSISVTNHPMPLTQSSDVGKVVDAVVNLFSTCVIMEAFAFIPAAIVAYIVREREVQHNSKHQQLISGVSLAAYWTSNFLWDICVYAVPLALSLLFIRCYGIDAFVQNGAFWASFVVLVGYGVAIAPFTYLLSFLFSKHTTAQVLCLVVSFLLGPVLVIVSYILSMIENTKAVNQVLMWIFRIFPGFCLGHGLLEICTNAVIAGLLDSAMDVDLLSWDIAGKDVLYLFVAAPVYFVLAWVADFVSHSPLAGTSKHFDPRRESAMALGEEVEDEDVNAEAMRVMSGAADGDVIRLVGLQKIYRTPEGKPKFAVRGLSFGLPRGECFGFLGINGAGKTSTLNMLTGVVLPSAGSAFLAGHDVVKEQWKVRRLIGYCPQHDALLDRLTVREHLQLFGRIKGIPQQELQSYCDKMMRSLDLSAHVDKLAMTLSGGNKRKLSLAIAMMGSPQLIFLDEPSTGVDPAARRLMWDVIAEVSTVRRESSVVLTTHNMEEAEALCSRVGIMVGGRLRCLGTNQHLKARFGEGYQLEARLAAPNGVQLTEAIGRMALPEQSDMQSMEAACSRLGNPSRFGCVRAGCEEGHVVYDALAKAGWVSAVTFAEWWLVEDRMLSFIDFLQQAFPGAAMLERHDRTLRFRLPASCPIAQVFRCLEQHRTQLSVEEYGISQTSLEQLFNEFASKQQEETGPVRGMVPTGQELAGP